MPASAHRRHRLLPVAGIGLVGALAVGACGSDEGDVVPVGAASTEASTSTVAPSGAIPGPAAGTGLGPNTTTPAR